MKAAYNYLMMCKKFLSMKKGDSFVFVSGEHNYFFKLMSVAPSSQCGRIPEIIIIDELQRSVEGGTTE